MKEVHIRVHAGVYHTFAGHTILLEQSMFDGRENG